MEETNRPYLLDQCLRSNSDHLLAVGLHRVVVLPLAVDLILVARHLLRHNKGGYKPRKSPSTPRWVHDGSQHVLPTTDQSPIGSAVPNKHQSTTNQVHNTATEDERTNRFDRALLREQVVDRNSPCKDLVVLISTH